MKVRVTIDADLRFEGAPEAFVDALDEQLAREAPVRGARGRVVGVTRLSLVRREEREVVVPRGALSALQAAAQRCGIALSYEPRVVGADEVGASRPAGIGISLRPYQRAAVDEMRRRVQCLVRLPCGGGKTTIGAAAIVELGIPALVVAPTTDIVAQWIETLDRVGADRVARAKPGVGPPRPGCVVVGTPQSIPEAVLRGVGVVVVDECHRTLARTWSALLSRCPARYRWGLTATVERSDRQEWALPYLFGPLVEPATTADLVRAGWLSLPLVVGVQTGWAASGLCRPVVATCPSCGASRSHPRSAFAEGRVCGARIERGRCRALLSTQDLTGEAEPIDWSAAIGEIATSETRNQLLLQIAEAARAGGRTSLTLVSTVAQAEGLALRAGRGAASLSGDDGKRRRREVIDGLTSGEIHTVYGTKVADEGLDVPTLGCVVLADPGRAKGRALQRAGRSTRPKGQTPIVVDLVDQDPEFASQWRSRSGAFAREYGAGCLRPGLASPAEILRLLADRPG